MKDKVVIELVIALAIVGFALWSFNKNPNYFSNNKIDTTQVDTKATGTKTGTTKSTPDNISYAEALRIYKNTRIQLDANCQATPPSVTYKNGTLIMIDNRASVARTVKAGSSFSIPAYGFKIVKLSSSTLPTTWYLDCDNSQNVATILIQK